MRPWLGLLVVSAFGCSPFPDVLPGDGGTIDAPPLDAPLCFGSFPQVCFTSYAKLPTAPMTLANDIDTDSPVCDQSQPNYCVVAAAGLTIPAGTTIRAFGSRPLVLLSTASFDLSGNLDVSSISDPVAAHPTGPGVVTIAACATGTAAAEADSGGFGGSFGGKGGDGQKQTTGNTPTAGPAVPFPSTLRAGCPGGSGNSILVATQSPGGNGGGAVSIIATDIHLNGRINASGAAGAGGILAKIGGGGGGSGGMIVLDTPTIIPGASYALYANGGGGGQGGAILGTHPGSGQSGGESTGPTIPGIGGNNNSTDGGAGGGGAYGSLGKDGSGAAVGALPNTAGGGAGGGGAGFIRAPGITMNIAPASTNP